MRNLKQLAALLSVLMLSATAFSAPQLTIKESIFNFGYVPQNSKVHTGFWLYSTGDDSLKILRVVPG